MLAKNSWSVSQEMLFNIQESIQSCYCLSQTQSQVLLISQLISVGMFLTLQLGQTFHPVLRFLLLLKGTRGSLLKPTETSICMGCLFIFVEVVTHFEVEVDARVL